MAIQAENSSITVSVVQDAPEFLGLERTLQKTEMLVANAADAGADVVVFPEAFLSGYPFWLWGNDASVERDAFLALWSSSLDVPGACVDQLSEMSRRNNVVLVIGVNERESAFGRSTIFNTMLTFDATGDLVRRHRKLIPTYKERTDYGMGDGSGMPAADTGAGRFGGLICWENFMPLARFFQYAQGAEVYTAVTVDDSKSWQTLMQTVAAEGRLFVAAACQWFPRSTAEYHDFLRGFPAETDVLCSGGSVIVEPGGEIVAGPLFGSAGILTETLDLSRVTAGKHSLDVTGHYSRSDIFGLTVDIDEKRPFRFD